MNFWFMLALLLLELSLEFVDCRFQMLRDLIPENDQKRDKASLLLEVGRFQFSLIIPLLCDVTVKF